METLKKILLSTPAKRAYWTMFNAFVGLMIVVFSEINFLYAPILIGILNSITKEINKRYL